MGRAVNQRIEQLGASTDEFTTNKDLRNRDVARFFPQGQANLPATVILLVGDRVEINGPVGNLVMGKEFAY